MIITLNIDGEERKFDLNDGRLTTVNKEPEEVEVKTGYERLGLMERYYMTDGTSQPETYHPEDTKRYENADYFASPTLAADVARAQEIWRKLLRWQAENDAPDDWENDAIDHYYIYYNYYNKTFHVGELHFWRDAFNVYFSTVEKAEQALEIFREDLTWLFTEFQYRLDGTAGEGE